MEKIIKKAFNLTTIKTFLKQLKKNEILGYLYFITNLLILFYCFIIIAFGPSENLPVPFEIPTIQDITFIILISYSFYLLFLFCATLIPKLFNSIMENNTIFKLIGLHIASLIISLFIPVSLFIGVYLFAYFIWYTISSIIFILFVQDISLKVLGKMILKDGKKSLLLYLLFWITSIIGFGGFFFFVSIESLDFTQQMIFLVFPLFQIFLPIIGLIFKPNSGNRAPVSFYGFLIFLITLYHWFRYYTWTPTTSGYSFIDALIDLSLISYTFFSLVKNAIKIKKRLPNIIKIESLMLLFIWTRISSMILLLSVGDYQLFGYSAIEGSYLTSILLIIIVGLVLGIIWIRQGISKDDLDFDISLPEIADNSIH
ncbi:MAG: hypothetical protein GF311_10805 [Candidatus Lokiarchaeota archaeon]|nr:hypothetical protein [Candidatus Lokiarchaeota archaeon]